MTAYNNKIRYKIEVYDIDSHIIELPATITTNFTAGEIVNGDDSGASAVVIETTQLTDTTIKVKNKDGFFYELEGLTGGSGGEGSKTGTTERTSSPYTNEDYNIDDGTWTLFYDGENGHLLTGIDNATQKINISKGGNLASGYTFGFEIENFGFAELMQSDGVYFKNRKCSLYIGLVDGVPATTWSKEWTGIIDTFTDAKEGSLKFKCTDITKSNVENVGSKEVPICLNKNYNCKLISQDEILTEYAVDKYDYTFEDIKDTNILEITSSALENSLIISFSEEGNYLENYESNFNNGYLEVTAGDGVGGIFKIYSTKLGTFTDGRWPLTIYFLEDISGLKSSNNGTTFRDASLVRIFSKAERFNVSENTVHFHNDFESINEKPLTITDNKREVKLKRYLDYQPGSWVDFRSQIEIDSLTKDNEKTTDTKILLEDRYAPEIVYGTYGGKVKVAYKYNLSYSDLSKLENAVETNEDVYFDIEKSILSNFFVFPENQITYSVVDFNVEIGGFYKGEIYRGGFSSFLSYGDPEVPQLSSVGDTLTASYSDGLNQKISNLLLEKFNKKDLFKSIKVAIVLDLYITGTTLYEPTYELVGAGLRAVNEIGLDNMSIGCDGENVNLNVYPGGIDTVPNTIQYLLENYYNKSASDIDLASFDQAQEDFDLYVDDPERNAAHQIVEQNGGNSLLKEILYSHILGMFPARDGLYTLENWLPKSTIFGSTPTLADFDDTNVLSDPKTGKPRISKITRDDINNVISDYEFDVDFNESTGKYDRTIRIKNTNEVSFNFERDTEGIDIEDTGLAEGAWIQGNSGNNRVDKQTQTKQSSKWIKLSNSDGTGTSEAVAFIRNILSHVNRQHEYITFPVPINTANLSLELLSFISILDPKITDNVTRKCWIVERKLNTKDDYIEFKVLLDIHPYDQYLQRVNSWQDGDNVEIKEDGDNPTNVKQNGLGV